MSLKTCPQVASSRNEPTRSLVPETCVQIWHLRATSQSVPSVGAEMDMMCAEFIAEDLWLGSLRVTCTSIVDSDSEPVSTGLETVPPASLQDLLWRFPRCRGRGGRTGTR